MKKKREEKKTIYFSFFSLRKMNSREGGCSVLTRGEEIKKKTKKKKREKRFVIDDYPHFDINNSIVMKIFIYFFIILSNKFLFTLILFSRVFHVTMYIHVPIILFININV